MSVYALLAALLLLAWAANAIASPRERRGLGLSSGTEFLLAGLLLGPTGAGLISAPILRDMAPATFAAASWLALLAGSHLGRTHKHRGPAHRRLLGLATSVAVFLACAGSTWLLSALFSGVSGHERLYLALGFGCAASETARAAIVWSAEQTGARGPLQHALMDFAEEDDVVPLLGLAALFALAPRAPALALLGAPPTAFAVTLGIGGIMGIVAAILANLEARRGARWVIVIGAAALVTGVTARIGLAAPAALMAMGATLNLFSAHGRRLHDVLATTARPVLLPVIAIAGASLDLHAAAPLWLLAVLVPLARLVVKVPVVAAVRTTLAPPHVPSRAAGLSLLACGPITVCVGLTMAAGFPGQVGHIVLAACLLSIIIGDIVGYAALRHELKNAGEWRPVRNAPTPPPTS
ncbi:MAG: hypothetical protein EPN72_11000 [Nevskiaceae bacterium]|nr:MAG: hypothetical protein EPN63_06010 [Nevskiaceae bacterium]TBR72259.1 MAG: hypothetical protein EPN72_11000 [Nevskiaceae bacterium]